MGQKSADVQKSNKWPCWSKFATTEIACPMTLSEMFHRILVKKS